MSKENRRNIEEAGFVRINGKWRRRCCGICVTSHPTYHLFETHLKESPNCPYIRLIYGEETVREYVRNVNVATSDIRQEYGVDVRCPKEVFPSDSQTFQKQFGQNSERSCVTVDGIPLEKPRYPDFADEDNNANRAKTYSNPTAHVKEIRAGFFIDRGRHTCYQCGVQLILQEGDDPELQHAALSPYCMHINCLKGRAFVIEVQELVQANSRRTQQDPDNCAEYQEIYCREAVANVSSDNASQDQGASGDQDVSQRDSYDPRERRRGRSPRRGDPGPVRTNPRDVPRRHVYSTTRGQQHTKINIRPLLRAREHQQQRSSGIGLNQEAERRCCQDPASEFFRTVCCKQKMCLKCDRDNPTKCVHCGADSYRTNCCPNPSKDFDIMKCCRRRLCYTCSEKSPRSCPSCGKMVV